MSTAPGRASCRCSSVLNDDQRRLRINNSQVIGIDLGGTAIKLARFSRSGEVLAEA